MLRNYITYDTACKLARKNDGADEEVDSKKARKEIGIWIKLHPHNIGQRVQVIVEHFRKHVQHTLGGQTTINCIPAGNSAPAKDGKRSWNRSR